MDVLILGGTAQLGRQLAGSAVAAGHTATCLARGQSGPVAEGAVLVRADRSQPGAYDAVGGRHWDEVVEISWQPGFVRDALAALGDRAGHWTYISSGSVYASHERPGNDELAQVLPPTQATQVDREEYGNAKVACEQLSAEAVGDRLLVARAGLIGGPEDDTDRTGWWVARAARDRSAPMIVPDALDQGTQVIDVRDLCEWLVSSAQAGLSGTFNTVGPELSLGEWIAASREVGGHTGPVVKAPQQWLIDAGVREWAGPESLPMWIADPDWQGFAARSGAAAISAGLRHRSRTDLLTDTLAWERAAGLARERKAGLSATKESELVAALLR